MYREIFPIKLKAERELLGLTQEEFAKKLNVSRVTFTNYELGKREPDIEKLGQIADICERSVDWLIGR